MKLSDKIIYAGYKGSWAELSFRSGWPATTLRDMANKHPKRFNTVLNGAKANAKEGEE